MKYTTINYDSNRPNRNAITVPLNSNYGVAVKVQKDGAAVELSSGQMTIDGVQETGVRDGWLQYDLSSGPTPCTLHKQFEIKTGEDSQLSGFDENAVDRLVGGVSLTINKTAKLPSSMAVSPSEIQEWYAECQLSGDSGILSTWTTSYENNSNFTVVISRNSYFINSDGLWELTRSGATTSALTFSSSQPMRLTIDTSSMPLQTYLLVRYVMNSRKAPDPIHFDLTVQEKDLGYFEVPRMQPEPEPEPPEPGTLILSAFTELSAPLSTVTVSPTAEYDSVSFTLSAADVASLMCVVQVEGETPEKITGSEVQIQDEGVFEYWYIDPENPDVWTMWDGSETRPEIELKGGNEFKLSSYEQPAGKSMTAEFKLYRIS